MATLNTSLQPLLPLNAFGLSELETLRLILRGGSVIDWRRLAFRSRDEVDRFIRLHLLDPNDPRDEARMRSILRESVQYLRTTFRYRVASAVAEPHEIHDLFLYASGHGAEKLRRIACLVLKVMHITAHVDARELVFRSPVSEAELAQMVDARMMACAKEMRDSGFPILEFQGNLKSRHSVITKLLAKKETLAAQVFDRVRYRIVTPRREDVAPVVNHLTHTLFPFSLIVPGQTQNTLLSFKKLLRESPPLSVLAPELQMDLNQEERDRQEARRAGNPFSGPSYRVLNFVVDLPLRLDATALMRAGEEEGERDLGHVVYQLVELQILDAETARENEEGENSHAKYKKRQLRRVLRRLSRGLVVPKPKLDDEPKSDA